ncbi:MAG: hypothetical protein CMI90_04090 [Pelagibacteraceae bacterium]|nr:hypothetical protein [Pelagibacteraceae bacterium]
MKVLVDIGNSSIKKMYFLNNELKNKKTLNYSKSNLTNIYKFLEKDIKNNKTIYSCSVVPEVDKFLKKKHKNIYFLDKKLIKMLISKKVNLKQLGSDRIANFLGCLNEFPKSKNFLIIDFGTATTIDIIKNSVYEGGIILPGLLTSYNNLIDSASLINNFKFDKTKLIYGKNTSEALLSGSYNGYSILIEGYIKKLNSLFNKKFKIAITGGYGNIFINKFKNSYFDNNLTFKGLKYYLNNFL